MTDLFIMAAAAAGLAIVIVAARWLDAEQLAGQRRSYRLSFPQGVTPEAVTTYLGGLGLRPLGPSRLVSAPAVVLELTASRDGGVVHHLTVPARWADTVLGRLAVALGGTRIVPDSDHQPPQVTAACELRLKTGGPLRQDVPAAASAAVLAACYPLGDGEAVVMQWVIAAAGSPSGSNQRGRSDRRRDSRDGAALMAVARLGATASTPERSRHLVRRMQSAFETVAAPGARLTPRQLPTRLVVRRLERQTVPLVHWPVYVTAAGLTGIIGLPIGSPMVPGLALGGCRPLPPSPVVPSLGTVLCRSNYPGLRRFVAIAPEDRAKHMAIFGPTGSGKTVLLTNITASDIRAGYGVVAITLTGDFIAQVVERIPADRVQDVVLLDAADPSDRVVGFDLLAGADTEPDRAVDDLVHLFRQLHADSWGPRLEDILRSGLRTLTHRPGHGLLDLPRLLSDDAWRSSLVADVTDPDLLDFWRWYSDLSRAERASVVSPVVNKARPVALHRDVRHIVGQVDPGLDLDRVLAEGRIALVSLPSAVLGGGTARFLASLVATQLWAAIRRRAVLSPAERRPVMVCLDEVADLLDLPTGLPEMLAQARSLGVGVTLAAQHPDQLPPDVRAAVASNARTKLTFQASAQAARFLAPEFPGLSAADLQGLEPFEAAVAVAVGPTTAPPATGTTLPLVPSTGRSAAVRAWSRQHYGRDRSEIEAALRARRTPTAPDSPIGRKRRAS